MVLVMVVAMVVVTVVVNVEVMVVVNVVVMIVIVMLAKVIVMLVVVVVMAVFMMKSLHWMLRMIQKKMFMETLKKSQVMAISDPRVSTIEYGSDNHGYSDFCDLPIG